MGFFMRAAVPAMHAYLVRLFTSSSYFTLECSWRLPTDDFNEWNFLFFLIHSQWWYVKGQEALWHLSPHSTPFKFDLFDTILYRLYSSVLPFSGRETFVESSSPFLYCQSCFQCKILQVSISQCLNSRHFFEIVVVPTFVNKRQNIDTKPLAYDILCTSFSTIFPMTLYTTIWMPFLLLWCSSQSMPLNVYLAILINSSGAICITFPSISMVNKEFSFAQVSSECSSLFALVVH